MRINLLAGPGAGKSTTAATLFSDLKRADQSVELVTEYVKGWAYEKRHVYKYDQLYIFAKQHHSEYRLLKNGVQHVVSDSPVFLSLVYADAELRPGLWSLIQAYEKEYPSLNIFLERGTKKYFNYGRGQSEEEARAIDSTTLRTLEDYKLPYHIRAFDDYHSIKDLVFSRI